MKMYFKIDLRILGIALIGLGSYIVADGIGSILEQPTQPFWCWQLVRVVRSCVGGVLIVVGANLLA
jgi:hypothetical protein